MKQEIIKQMEKYNKIIISYKMADLFYNNSKIPDEKKLNKELMDKLNRIVAERELVRKELDSNSVKISDNELVHGFHIEFRIQRYTRYGY